MLAYPYVHRYHLRALSSVPILANHLLDQLSDGEADFTPDRERFTIREAIAHLADWDEIWLARIERICAEDNPELANIDEGQLALDRNYAQIPVADSLAKFRNRREALVARLSEVTPEQWSRSALRPEIGVLTLENLALLIPLHDNYHLTQFAEWRAAVGGKW